MGQSREGSAAAGQPPPAGLPGPGVEAAMRPALAAATRALGLDGALLLQADEPAPLAWALAAGPLAEDLAAAAGPLWDGPCADALAGRGPVVVDGLPVELRWPALAELAALCGHGGLLCVPVGGGALAAVRRARRPFTPEEVEAVVAFAGVLAKLLEAVTEVEAQREVIDQLEHALSHRVVIEQAKGILMAWEALEPAEAFDRLRQVARASRRRVSEVAEEMVSGRQPDHPG